VHLATAAQALWGSLDMAVTEFPTVHAKKAAASSVNDIYCLSCKTTILVNNFTLS